MSRNFLTSCATPAARELAPVLERLAATHGMVDNVTFFRRDRELNMGKARLCASVVGRQTWVDLAREANARLVRSKRMRRLHERTDAEIARLYGPEVLTRRQAGGL